MGPSRQLASTLGPVLPAARALASQMDLTENAEYIADRIMAIVLPERGNDDAFRELLLRNAYDNLNTMWRIIAGRDELDATPPFGAIAFSDTAAQIGVPISQFERVYRVGCGLVWSLWYLASVEYAAANQVALSDLLGGPSMIIHSYIDGQISTMLSRYESAQAEHMRTREQLQVSILRQALEGGAALGERDIEAALGMPLGGEHIAVAIRAERSPAESGLLRHAQQGVPGSHALLYRQGVCLWVVWLSHPRALHATDVQRLCEVLAGAPVRAALGVPARGLAGLGGTGRDALEALRLQDMLGPAAGSVVSYEDLRLESLMLSEPDRARRFVRDELRGLDADDARTVALRDTAREWLTLGSHVSTAVRLGVHEHTVRNRIAQVEAILGASLVKRRTEVLVALRLKRMLEQEPAEPLLVAADATRTAEP